MMQCRMCSQRLTRPGKLCRECEHELGRARAVAASVDTLAGAVPLIEASRLAAGSPGRDRIARLRSRPAALAAAFTIGLATAAGAYVVQRTHATAPASVMLDQDLRNIKPRSFGAPQPAHATAFQENGSPPTATPGRADSTQPLHAAKSPSRHATAARSTRIDGASIAMGDEAGGRKPAAGVLVPDSERLKPATLIVATSGNAPAGLDRILALSSALETCAQEPLFSRIACDYRARIRYCDGAAARTAQCGGYEGPIEHGQ